MALRVAAITGGRNIPSARFRARQLIGPLRHHQIHVQEFCPPINKIPPKNTWLRPAWGLAALATRIPIVMATHRFDITFLQRELISTLSTLEVFTQRPRVFDVDDAIFLYRGGKFAMHIAKNSDLIVCGNQFLAENFSKWNQEVCIIPTAVDVKRYTPLPPDHGSEKLVLGWIGTSVNLKYLYKIEDALVEVIKAKKDVIVRVISDMKPHFRLLPEEHLEYIPWSPKTEVQHIQSMTVGLMPLDNSLWARGKCSYKMLQYMACGIPVVVSPVGMNAEVLSLAEVGVGAQNCRQWVDGMMGLLSDRMYREKIGINARKTVERRYSVDKIACSLAKALNHLI